MKRDKRTIKQLAEKMASNTENYTIEELIAYLPTIDIRGFDFLWNKYFHQGEA